MLFIAADGITDFSIAQAKHCNLVCRSFVLRTDWLKPFLTDHAIACGVNGLNSFTCLWCNTTIITIGKSAFPSFVILYDETKVHFGCGYLEISPEVRHHWQQCCHFWYFHMTSDVMFSDKFLMFWRKMWCWLGCFYNLHISSHFRTKIS